MNDANPPAAELGITVKDTEADSSSEVTEKLFGQSLVIKRLEKGKPIPVGGSSIFTDNVDRKVAGDFDHFNDLFEEMHRSIEIYDSENLKKWLEAQRLPINPRLLAILTAFTRKLAEKYPVSPEHASIRKSIYAQTGREIKLSEVFENHGAECAEIAALAQYFLQDEGVNSSFFSGEVLWSKEDEFGEKHTFIVIEDRGRQYIFDPANPTKTQDGIYPSLYMLKADFNAEARKGQKKFVAGTNILTKQEAFYGVGNGTNVSPVNILI